MSVRNRAALIFQLLLALAGWGAVCWVVTRRLPTDLEALTVFYGALFVSLSATVGSLLWLLFRGVQPPLHPKSSVAYLGHGMVFSGLALLGLWLQSLRLLTPLHVVMLIGLYLFFELALALGGRGT